VNYLQIYFYTFSDYDQNISIQHTIIKRDYTKAFKFLEKGANKNYPLALYQLGIMYHCGYGIEQDHNQGEKYFNEVVDIDLGYMGSIAVSYHTRDGMQDFVKALQWYRGLEKRLDEDLKKSNRRDINKLVQLGLRLLYEYGRLNFQFIFCI
jgi:TPR repeat protein